MDTQYVVCPMNNDFFSLTFGVCLYVRVRVERVNVILHHRHGAEHKTSMLSRSKTKCHTKSIEPSNSVR